MRDLLKMSGAATSDINHLETKARSYELSEGQIRDVYPLALLKAIFPASVATKMKTCVGEKLAAPFFADADALNTQKHTQTRT